MAWLDRFFDVLRGVNPFRARGTAPANSGAVRAVEGLAVDQARQQVMPSSLVSQSAGERAETRRGMEAELDTQREARVKAGKHGT
jgi:hypothetical protein